MTKGITQAALRTFAELLKVQTEATDRMQTLERFDSAFGASIPEWENQMKELLGKDPDAEDAIKSIDDFYAKYHAYDEDGKLIYERIRMGNTHHVLTITFDTNAPEGQQIKIEEYPAIDSMSLEELREYYNELEEAFSDLESEEPDEDSDEYDDWEEECSDLEGLMEEVQERIDMLEEDEPSVKKFGISVELSVQKTDD